MSHRSFIGWDSTSVVKKLDNIFQQHVPTVIRLSFLLGYKKELVEQLNDTGERERRANAIEEDLAKLCSFAEMNRLGVHLARNSIC